MPGKGKAIYDSSHYGKHGGKHGNGSEGINAITAPYNFVPLSKYVYFPDWAKQVSHDIPFSNGISGTIKCTLRAESPIYVRNGGNWKDGDKLGNHEAYSFFKVGDQYMIPGTSIKGMIRNVIEIITFGKIGSRIDDRRYAVRDLSKNTDPKLYKEHMTEPGGPPFKSKVKAGWLTMKDDDLFLEECEHARVEQDDLMIYALSKGKRVDLKGRQSSIAKYQLQWGDLPLKVSCTVQAGNWSHSCGRISYKKVITPIHDDKGHLAAGQQTGTIVFTGQPGAHETSLALSSLPDRLSPHNLSHRIKYKDREGKLYFYGVMSIEEKNTLLSLDSSGNKNYKTAIDALYLQSFTARNKQKKHMEFIFFDKLGTTPERLSHKLMDDFEFIHNTKGRPNEEWAYWKPKLENRERIPVFFLGDATAPSSMGLAFMYRLAYTHSVHAAARHTHPNHVDCACPDFADLLFGYVEGESALKGRISFSPAIAGSGIASYEEPIEAILGGPKPTYYPNYLEQRNIGANGNIKTYETFMDDKCEIRGWKRYPARGDAAVVKKPVVEKRQEKLDTMFTPLKAGAVFEFTIRVHNLKPIELGALFWALEWGGGNDTLRHSLGMGKSFGFGQVTIVAAPGELHLPDRKRIPHEWDKKHFMDLFVDHMETDAKVDNWKNTEQLFQLLAMADPKTQPHGTTQQEKLKHMRLDGGNQFVEAKGKGLYLRPHADFTLQKDRDKFQNIGNECPETVEQKEVSAQPVAVEPPAVPMTTAERFYNDRNNADKLLELFTELTTDNEAELEAIDFVAAKSALNIGITDRLQTAAIVPEIKAVVARKILTMTKQPDKKWADDKRARYERLRQIARQVISGNNFQ